MNPALIVALDVPNLTEMEKTLDRLPDSIEWYKVGLEIFCAEGPAILSPLKQRNKKIFLDLKLHDIPRTVANAVKTAANHGVNLMTVHAIGGRAMLEAAAQAARECDVPPKLVAVTTLTSLSQDDFSDLGINRTVSEQALALGDLAIGSGIDGLVTSAHEAEALSQRFPEALLVTPGIRMPDGDIGDQKRVATPSFAVQQGATHLVVGRPIVQAEQPANVTAAIQADMKNALS
ncbi:orotidine-5'-phosphate decarboxylase [Tichowtungia aerotolerans]|uniref:Orotidine 5'-phosphate decarboxylase n=1 Tax=Tichowtungia aerotolerans TaxID=2697043 RepID=A0A6P1M7V9_9BACT|nr:orotidine-5'-phosphate decarboxylase [Tichowtungia aerotolerans]QHI68614.1 orotidine-5'-phosphate decarboxylase [Tichowtungia aerotolerans]